MITPQPYSTAAAVPRHIVSAPLPLPSPRETHFWYAVPDEVKDASLLNYYMDLLSPSERRNVETIREEKLRKCALITRALIRTTLARYTDSKVDPRLVEFRKNKFGKPEVVWQHFEGWDPPPIQFNVSHTSSLIACGVALGVQIGIDIEEKGRLLRNNILAFARRFLSHPEVEFLCSLSEPESQRREFLKLWTLKEAYVKAVGGGFSAIPFKDFVIRIEAEKDVGSVKDSASNISLEATGDSRNVMPNCQFGLFELNGDHYGAVCLEADKGRECDSIRLKAWRTLPFVEDECVTETNAIINISSLT